MKSSSCVMSASATNIFHIIHYGPTMMQCNSKVISGIANKVTALLRCSTLYRQGSEIVKPFF